MAAPGCIGPGGRGVSNDGPGSGGRAAGPDGVIATPSGAAPEPATAASRATGVPDAAVAAPAAAPVLAEPVPPLAAELLAGAVPGAGGVLGAGGALGADADTFAAAGLSVFAAALATFFFVVLPAVAAAFFVVVFVAVFVRLLPYRLLHDLPGGSLRGRPDAAAGSAPGPRVRDPAPCPSRSCRRSSLDLPVFARMLPRRIRTLGARARTAAIAADAPAHDLMAGNPWSLARIEHRIRRFHGSPRALAAIATRKPPHRHGGFRVSSRPPNGRPTLPHPRHRAVPGKARPAGIPPGASGRARARGRAFGRRSRWTLDLLRPRSRHLRVDRRTAGAAPRRRAGPVRRVARGAGRRDRGGAAAGDDLAVVEQGHRHRPPLWSRERVAHRARHRMDGRARRRRTRAKSRERSPDRVCSTTA